MRSPLPPSDLRPARTRSGRFAARMLVLASTASLAVLVVQSSLATVLARYDGRLAATVTPWDARALLAAARDKVGHGASPQSPGVQALAHTALLRDATLPGAVELVALADDAHGDERAAGKLFALSDAISRRSLTTRLWLIQQAVQRGSIDAALTNFDIALRTSTEAPARLYPILVKASADPAIAAALARRLDQPVEWRPTFLDFVAHRGAPEGAARLLLAMQNRDAVARTGAVPILLKRLVDADRFALARQLYLRFSPPDARAALLADPQFGGAGIPPFGWSLTNANGVAAFLVRRGGNGALGFTAEAGRGGLAASQLLTLPSGRYRLDASLHAVSDGAARPFWVVACTDHPEKDLLRFDVPSRRSGAEFTVPERCGAQWLVLGLRASFGGSALSGEVGPVSLRRVQTSRTIPN